jgi:hypothetical protein
MSSMRLLQSATTTSPVMQSDGVSDVDIDSDIDIDSPPATHREQKKYYTKTYSEE